MGLEEGAGEGFSEESGENLPSPPYPQKKKLSTALVSVRVPDCQEKPPTVASSNIRLRRNS